MADNYITKVTQVLLFSKKAGIKFALSGQNFRFAHPILP
jgi:hypothetical protein